MWFDPYIITAYKELLHWVDSLGDLMIASHRSVGKPMRADLTPYFRIFRHMSAP
ncbi:MAG: hypothetical protein PHT12_01365 [Patescibacteria group bacterium]|nr:hypothetical protein [Patescibacteria group bacterium]